MEVSCLTLVRLFFFTSSRVYILHVKTYVVHTYVDTGMPGSAGAGKHIELSTTPPHPLSFTGLL